MEPIDIHKASESSYSSIQEERAVPETVDLLEESWFFGNLLNNQKPKMSRCYSDPCPSSITKLSHDMSFKISLENNQNSSMSTSKTEAKAEDFRPNLVRTPSLPLNIGRKEEEEGIQVRHGDNKVSKMNHEVVQPTELHLGKKEGTREKERNSTRSKTTGQSVPLQPSKSMLVRTQTLPTSIKRVELNQDQEESHRTMSKSSRQVSFNLADILPPRHNKVILPSLYYEDVYYRKIMFITLCMENIEQNKNHGIFIALFVLVFMSLIDCLGMKTFIVLI